jgi:hypothetical protein
LSKETLAAFDIKFVGMQDVKYLPKQDHMLFYGCTVHKNVIHENEHTMAQ